MGKKVTILGLLILKVLCCSFNGLDSGKCINKNEAFNFESFCKDLISDYICVPIYQEIWEDWTLLKKDLEVEKRFVRNLIDKVDNELGSEKSDPTFTRKFSCLPAYKKFTCILNYPPCDPASSFQLYFS